MFIILRVLETCETLIIYTIRYNIPYLCSHTIQNKIESWFEDQTKPTHNTWCIIHQYYHGVEKTTCGGFLSHAIDLNRLWFWLEKTWRSPSSCWHRLSSPPSWSPWRWSAGCTETRTARRGTTGRRRRRKNWVTKIGSELCFAFLFLISLSVFCKLSR